VPVIQDGVSLVKKNFLFTGSHSINKRNEFLPNIFWKL
jgi:hypothetical protein